MSNEEEDKKKEGLREGQELGPQFGSNVGVMTGKEPRKGLPANFKATRNSVLQLSPIERDLFTDMRIKEAGNYVISGITQKVSAVDFAAFTIAAAQILFNQSYTNRNEDINSGISRREARKLSRDATKTLYTGEIYTTLNEICRLAYGVDEPSTKQRKAMETLLETLHNTPVTITIPGVITKETTLCATMEKTTQEDRKKGETVSYLLYLHPIFTEQIANNFIELPQNVMKRLAKATDRRTAAHLKLLGLLSLQDKSKPFTRRIETLIEELGLESSYRKDPGRTETQLLTIFKSMEDIGLLKEAPSMTYTNVRGKRRIEKVTFLLNEKFSRS